jgi:hypothetical protein
MHVAGLVIAQVRDVVVQTGVNGWQVAAAIGTCLTAVAAAWSARSSSRAASASLNASHDARQALGASTRPHIGTRYFNDERTLVASVGNHNQWAAADVSIELHLRDGRVRSDKIDRIDEAAGPMSKDGPFWTVRFEDVLSEDDPYRYGATVDYAAVRWSDAQRILQWEERTTFHPSGGQEQADRRIT